MALPDVHHTEDTSTPAIHGEGINFYYGKAGSRRQVLFDCSLHFHPGEISVLTGPSGAGKTTLLTLIGALRTLHEGRLTVLNRALNGMSPPEQILLRRDIGFIFQQHNLIDALTAADNVRLAMQLKNHYSADDLKNRPAALLDNLGLASYADVKPQYLSVGEQQRVAIARALVNNPPVILADEPTAALDQENEQRVIAYLQDLANKERRTILIVTHDMRIMEAADRVLTMDDGRIVSDRCREQPDQDIAVSQ